MLGEHKKSDPRSGPDFNSPKGSYLLHSLAVGAVGRVDGDDLAGLDKERNHDLGAGLEGDFLQGGSAGGVALDGGLGVRASRVT